MSSREITTHVAHNSDYGISCAVSSMRGRRFTMEDEHIVDMNFLGQYLLFAVFDGHGGDLTAKYCQTNFTQLLREKLRDVDFSNDALIEETLKQCFIELDRSICEMLHKSENESGTTAVCAIITNDKIIVANCGDSRSVLGTKTETVAMSFDHKPTHKTEKARIKDAGGIVILGRVNGDLAVSRALGDCSYKDKNREPEKELVSCVPDVRIQIRDPSHEVLFLACDGIWDVMKSEEAVAFFAEYKKSHNIENICEMILNDCYGKGSSDNMTLICIKFPETNSPDLTIPQESKENEEKK